MSFKTDFFPAFWSEKN